MKVNSKIESGDNTMTDDKWNRILKLAGKALSDGLIYCYQVYQESITIQWENGVAFVSPRDKPEVIQIGLDKLKSLYVEESFTILTKWDLNTIDLNRNPKITLGNGDVYKILYCGYYDNIKEPYITLLFNEKDDLSTDVLLRFVRGSLITQGGLGEDF